jgi:dihydroflavonol-4-reductase
MRPAGFGAWRNRGALWAWGSQHDPKEILTELAAITGRQPPRICLPHKVVLPIAWISEVWARMVSGKEPRVTLIGARLAKKRMFFSAEKARRALGLQPRPIREALGDVVERFRRNKDLT